MKALVLFIFLIALQQSIPVKAQDPSNQRKLKSVTSYNLERKTKELDHLTIYNLDGLKTEESEYFSDGMVKSKTLYEYDSKRNCIKITRYNPKGKIEKVTVNEYDANGNKLKESTLHTEKHLKTEKIFEYSYYQ